MNVPYSDGPIAPAYMNVPYIEASVYTNLPLFRRLSRTFAVLNCRQERSGTRVGVRKGGVWKGRGSGLGNQTAGSTPGVKKKAPWLGALFLLGLLLGGLAAALRSLGLAAEKQLHQLGLGLAVGDRQAVGLRQLAQGADVLVDQLLFGGAQDGLLAHAAPLVVLGDLRAWALKPIHVQLALVQVPPTTVADALALGELATGLLVEAAHRALRAVHQDADLAPADLHQISPHDGPLAILGARTDVLGQATLRFRHLPPERQLELAVAQVAMAGDQNILGRLAAELALDGFGDGFFEAWVCLLHDLAPPWSRVPGKVPESVRPANGLAR